MERIIIIVALLSWAVHSVLGFWQIHRFNRTFESFCQRHRHHRILIGRSSSRFFKVLIIIALDEEHIIADAFIMQGLSVFAQGESLANCKGYHLKELKPELLFPHSKGAQQALAHLKGA